jgi:hypothetical protein
MNPYNIDTTHYNINKPIISLNVLYKHMPETTGCEKCKEVNGDNAEWCCRLVSPSMYYVEFLNIWLDVQNWNKEKRLAIILRAIKNYLSNNDSKGCIFFQEKCLCYSKRPLQCRNYGVMPNEVWDKRVEYVKKLFDWEKMSDNFKKKLIQCPLVTCTNGHKNITSIEEQKWFDHTRQCEKELGIPTSTINEHDGAKGCYRTFHDHIMLEFFDDAALNHLTRVKMQMPSEEDIQKFSEVLLEKISERI